MSKLVLEPETHSGIARAGAIPSLVCSLPGDGSSGCCTVHCQRLAHGKTFYLVSLWAGPNR